MQGLAGSAVAPETAGSAALRQKVKKLALPCLRPRQRLVEVTWVSTLQAFSFPADLAAGGLEAAAFAVAESRSATLGSLSCIPPSILRAMMVTI